MRVYESFVCVLLKCAIWGGWKVGGMNSASGTLAFMVLAMISAGCVSGSGESTGAASPVVLGGVISSQVKENERQRAYEAQLSAMLSGQRTTWRGDSGSYGFIEPCAAVDGLASSCRDYTHTVYIDGRPQRGSGKACRQPDGTWQIIS